MSSFFQQAVATFNSDSTKAVDQFLSGTKAKYLNAGDHAPVKIITVDTATLSEKGYFKITLEDENGAQHNQGVFPMDREGGFSYGFRSMLGALLTEDGIKLFMEQLGKQDLKFLESLTAMSCGITLGFGQKELGCRIRKDEQDQFIAVQVHTDEVLAGPSESVDDLKAEMEEKDVRRAWLKVLAWSDIAVDANTAQLQAAVAAEEAPKKAKKSKLDVL